MEQITTGMKDKKKAMEEAVIRNLCFIVYVPSTFIGLYEKIIPTLIRDIPRKVWRCSMHVLA